MSDFTEEHKTIERLEREGFQVHRAVRGASGAKYDIMAQRDGQSMVFEFVSQSQLPLVSRSISRLRQLARQDGYGDFRLVVVPEEKIPKIEILGLEEMLLSWLKLHPETTVGTPLENQNPEYRRISQPEIYSMSTRDGLPGLDASGLAVAEFVLPSHSSDTVWDCPISFDLDLDINEKVRDVNRMTFDTVSIADDLWEFLLSPVSQNA